MNIALVGAGFIGKAHLEAFERIDHCTVKKICVRKIGEDEKRIASTYQAELVLDYDELLKDADIDVIDICLPTYLHESYIIKAAKAGKHIFCEKPLSLTVASAQRIIDVVNENQVQLFVGHVLRFWPEYEYIKSKTMEGNFKNVDVFQGSRLGQKPNWSDWFQDPAKSGGALYDLHIHDIDFAIHLLGEVTKVYAVGHQNELGAWDHVISTLQFENGAIGMVEASHRMSLTFPFTMTCRVQAQNNVLDFKIEAGENIENIEETQAKFDCYENEQSHSIEVDQFDAFEKELTYFIHCLKQKKENTIIPLEDVLYTLKVLKAIEQSLLTDEEIVVKDMS